MKLSICLQAVMITTRVPEILTELTAAFTIQLIAMTAVHAPRILAELTAAFTILLIAMMEMRVQPTSAAHPVVSIRPFSEKTAILIPWNF
jgi:hypothetical protein